MQQIYEVWKRDGYGSRVVARFVSDDDAYLARKAIDRPDDPDISAWIAPLPLDNIETFLASDLVKTGDAEVH